MSSSLDLAAVARLVGDSARLKMLAALLAAGELAASGLAAVAGVSRQTASSHLGKLRQGGLITRAYSSYGGRHRVFRLAGDDVARAVAALVALAAAEPRAGSVAARQEATLCYGHLGGTLGSALLEALLIRGLLEPIAAPLNSVYDYRVTDPGAAFLEEFGIDVTGLQKRRRHFATRCLNAHEAAAHLSGSLGEALVGGLLERGWVVRDEAGGRILAVTAAGKDGLADRFGVRL